MKARVELGDRVRDRITGFQGIAVARTEWLRGCDRITIQPEELHDGKPIEGHTFDEPDLEILETGAVERDEAEPATKPGGPRPTPSRGR